jgi:hypothetical protein
MLVLRCTQKLLKKHLGPTDSRVDTLVPVLGNWHANLVHIAHFPIVLCANDETLLTVIVRGKDFPNFLTAFRTRVIQRLRRIGISEDIISTEQFAMEIVQIQPTNNKSVLGSMNDLVHHLRWQANGRFNFLKADALEDMLSEIPMGALKYACPLEAAAAPFGLKWKDSFIDPI